MAGASALFASGQLIAFERTSQSRVRSHQSR